jgi:hypothetical protein
MNDVSDTTVRLTADEATALGSLIKDKLGDLAGEVHKTDDYDYRQELKQHEALLRAVLAKLPQTA